MSVTIWHNPRCTKSRQTLALLTNRGLDPKVREYLKNPPEPEVLKAVLKMLGISPRDLMRKGESIYRELDLADEEEDEALVSAMYHHPILIERPVVIHGNKAAIGRPPEKVLEIL